jgi:hypothetical protein
MSNNGGVNSPDHLAARAMLRMIGPGVALLGLVLVGIGVASFFTAFGTFGPPRYFWCAFVGIPVLGLGLIMSQYGFLGSIFRYQAREATPALTEAFRAMSQGAAPGVRTMSRAQAAGLAESMGLRDGGVSCPKCHQANASEARYCNHCGTSLTGPACSGCGQVNPVGARFCNGCGVELAGV